MKSIKVFLKLCEMNLKMLFEYRASFFISLVLNGFFVLSYVVFIEVLFMYVDKLGNLNKGEALLVMAFFYLFQNISDIFYRDNFEKFADDMRRGWLDAWLTKPVSSRLLAFFHKMRFDFVSAIFITVLQFWYAYQYIDKPFSISFFMYGILASLVATVLMFAVFSIIATFSLWIEKNDTLRNLIWHMTQVGRYPRAIYTGVARIIFQFGLPLALIANIPAEITLKIGEPKILLFFILITIGLYYFSLWFWNFGLKRYSSAG